MFSAVLRGSDLDGWASSHCLPKEFINCKPICRKIHSAFLVSLSEVCLFMFWKATGLFLAISCIYTSSPSAREAPNFLQISSQKSFQGVAQAAFTYGWPRLRLSNFHQYARCFVSSWLFPGHHKVMRSTRAWVDFRFCGPFSP